MFQRPLCGALMQSSRRYLQMEGKNPLRTDKGPGEAPFFFFLSIIIIIII